MRAMKIAEIVIHQISMPLITPYRLSYRSFEAFEPLIVAARDTDGRVGWGETHISQGSSEETPEGGLAYTRAHAPRIVGMETGDAKALVRETMSGSKVAATGILTAIEMMEDHPALRVNEDARVPILTAFNAHEPGEIKDEVEARIAEGFRTFKLKVGKDVDADIKYVAEVQDAIAGRAQIRIDANRGFNQADGCKFASNLDPDGVMLFEQPCPSEAWDANGAVAKASTVPVMLDEPICSLADIERAGPMDGVGLCKVKLKRFGGIDLLVEAIELIKSLGMTPVLGDGTSIEVGSWMEACIARAAIDNAGEFNGFLKPRDRLFTKPLLFEAGDIVLPKGYYPEIDWEFLKSREIAAPERFAATQVAGAAE